MLSFNSVIALGANQSDDQKNYVVLGNGISTAYSEPYSQSPISSIKNHVGVVLDANSLRGGLPSGAVSSAGLQLNKVGLMEGNGVIVKNGGKVGKKSQIEDFRPTLIMLVFPDLGGAIGAGKVGEFKDNFFIIEEGGIVYYSVSGATAWEPNTPGNGLDPVYVGDFHGNFSLVEGLARSAFGAVANASIGNYASSLLNNTVTVRGKSAEVIDYAIGAQGFCPGCSPEKFSRNGVYVEEGKAGIVIGAILSSGEQNFVTLKDARIDNYVAGVISIGGLVINDTKVEILGKTKIGGSVAGTVFFIDDEAIVQSNNTNLIFDGNIEIKGKVYGAATADEEKLITVQPDINFQPIKNSKANLSFAGHVSTAGLEGFDSLTFNVREQNKIASIDDPHDVSKYILTINSEENVHLENKAILVTDGDGIVSQRKGERFGLIRLNSIGNPNAKITLNSEITLHETLLDEKFYVQGDAKEIFIQSDKVIVVPEEDEPEVIVPPSLVTPNENAKEINQDRLGLIASTKQGANFVAESGLTALKRSVLDGKHLFAASEAGANRYRYSGGHFRLNGGQIITGAVGNIGNVWVGPFFEASWAHGYNSKKSNSSTSANLASYGAGVLFGADIGQHFSLDGSLRAGKAKNRFKGYFNDVNDSVSFTGRSAYLSAHAGAAVNYAIGNRVNQSIFSRYIFTYLGSSSVNTGSAENDRYKAKHTTMHSVEAGLRTNFVLSETVALNSTFSIEQTFGGKARGLINDVDLDAISIKGTSGTGRLSLKFKPGTASPWDVEAGVNGYIGVRKGATGMLHVTRSF